MNKSSKLFDFVSISGKFTLKFPFRSLKYKQQRCLHLPSWLKIRSETNKNFSCELLQFVVQMDTLLKNPVKNENFKKSFFLLLLVHVKTDIVVQMLLYDPGGGGGTQGQLH